MKSRGEKRPSTLADSAAALVETGLILTDPAIIESHCKDYRGWYRGDAVGLARPKTVKDVQEIMRLAGAYGYAVVPQGGNTSLCGGAVPAASGPPSIILITTNLNAIRHVDRPAWSITVESGCTISSIQRAARSAGRHFGLDFGARDSATIGGALATNAGGMGVVRYGSCRDLTLGLEVVMPDGSLWSGLRSLRKDNSGFDLKNLFIGSEGTVGIITAASLKLHPEEKMSATALVALASLEAATDFTELMMEMASGQLSAIELLPVTGIRGSCEILLNCQPPIELSSEWYILCRLAGHKDVSEILEIVVSQALEDGICIDAVIAQSSAQETRLWEIRDSFSDLHRHLGASVRFDFAVPLGRVPDLYHQLVNAISRIEPDVVCFAFGHLGDGNLHFSACQPPKQQAAVYLTRKASIERAANEVVWRLDGTVSAEHGIGQLHCDELRHQKSDTELELMRWIRDAMDPAGTMNPGKFIPERSS